MTRYIDAEQAIHLIENDALLQVYYSKSDAIDCINVTPTADVAEVKHGEWVNKGDYAVCTECGERSGTQYDGVEPIPLMTKFCPNCGARMDESATDIFVGTY